jgi:RNA 3'-terminal phosphate cyclase
MPAGSKLLEINGALGEGGGQVLRSALTLAILTGKSTSYISGGCRRCE